MRRDSEKLPTGGVGFGGLRAGCTVWDHFNEGRFPGSLPPPSRQSQEDHHLGTATGMMKEPWEEIKNSGDKESRRVRARLVAKGTKT